MNENKDNPGVGKQFQVLVAKLLADHFNKEFVFEREINIGNPPKAHKFDLVSSDQSVIAECKCYTWTKGQNNPSAKMATLNEAVLFFKLLPDTCKKIIVMKKAIHPTRSETLAEYYFRIYSFVLEGITIAEVDPVSNSLRIINT